MSESLDFHDHESALRPEASAEAAHPSEVLAKLGEDVRQAASAADDLPPRPGVVGPVSPGLERDLRGGRGTVLQFPQRPWWSSAPNPACVEWCEVEHDPDEFAHETEFTRWRTVVDDERFTVRAMAGLGVDLDDLSQFGDRTTWPDVSLHTFAPTSADMRDLNTAHAAALELCGQVAERSGPPTRR